MACTSSFPSFQYECVLWLERPELWKQGGHRPFVYSPNAASEETGQEQQSSHSDLFSLVTHSNHLLAKTANACYSRQTYLSSYPSYFPCVKCQVLKRAAAHSQQSRHPHRLALLDSRRPVSTTPSAFHYSLSSNPFALLPLPALASTTHLRLPPAVILPFPAISTDLAPESSPHH